MNIKIKLKNEGKLLANADIMVPTLDYGELTIKNFQIWTSPIENRRLRERVNITPPTLNYMNMHHKMVFFEDLSYWELVELAIWKAYQLAVNKGGDDIFSNI